MKILHRPPADAVHDPAAGVPVTVGIDAPGVGRIARRVVEETEHGINDGRPAGADELNGSGVHRLRPLRHVAHNEDRLAQSGSLLLHASGISKHDMRALQQTLKRQIVEGGTRCTLDRPASAAVTGPLTLGLRCTG